MIMLVAFAIFMGPKIFFKQDVKAEVPSYITSCLQITAQDALIIFGQQGGFTDLPDNSHPTLKTAYLYENNTNLAPTKDEAAIQLANFVNNNIKECVDFTILKGYALLKESPPSTKVIIGRNAVEFILTFEFTLKKGEDELSYDKFQNTEAVDLGTILDITDQMVEDQVQNPGQVEVDHLFDDNLDIIFTSVENDLITSIKDLSYIIENKPYEFVFAQKYR